MPHVIVTGKLRSYGAAHRTVMSSVGRRTSKYLNNRAENSHLPTRQREKAMKGFRGVASAQRFLAAFSRISPSLPAPPPPPHRPPLCRTEMTERFTLRGQITGTTPTALVG